MDMYDVHYINTSMMNSIGLKKSIASPYHSQGKCNRNTYFFVQNNFAFDVNKLKIMGIHIFQI